MIPPGRRPSGRPARRTAASRAQALAAARTIVIMLHEVEVGVRPARVICPLFAVHLHERIHRTRRRPGPMPGVHRLVISPAADGAYEVLAVNHRGNRFGAVSLRLVDVGHGWLVTDLARPATPGGPGVAPLSDLPSGPASAGGRHG